MKECWNLCYLELIPCSRILCQVCQKASAASAISICNLSCYNRILMLWKKRKVHSKKTRKRLSARAHALHVKGSGCNPIVSEDVIRKASLPLSKTNAWIHSRQPSPFYFLATHSSSWVYLILKVYSSYNEHCGFHLAFILTLSFC